MNLRELLPVVAVLLAAWGSAGCSSSDSAKPAANKALAEGALRVNINTATLTELESIPGIGESLAKVIVARRPYQSVDQLVELNGIGPRSLEKLRPYIKTEGEDEKLR
jgi:competence ComEA-like helix-hairpin-helix protein